MSTNFDKTSEEDLREEARRRVGEKQGFRRHLISYLLFVAFFWVLWAVGERHMPPWPMWVTLGWGLAVVIQAVNVYGQPRDLEARIDREVEQMRQARQR